MASSNRDGAPSQDSKQEQSSAAPSSNVDLAQAYRDLARGEQAATALEANLSNLESRLDAMLAAFETPTAPAQASAAVKPAASIQAKEGATDKDNSQPNTAGKEA